MELNIYGRQKMSEYINTYESCEKHKNGHSGHCEKCETEAVRDKLREVAASEPWQDDPSESYVVIAVPRKTWDDLAPLRPQQLPRTRYEMTDAATATGMYD